MDPKSRLKRGPGEIGLVGEARAPALRAMRRLRVVEKYIFPF